MKISTFLPRIMAYGILPPSAECGVLLERYTAVKNNSPHRDLPKPSSSRRLLTIAVKFWPSHSETPICCGIETVAIFWLMPRCKQVTPYSCAVYYFLCYTTGAQYGIQMDLPQPCCKAQTSKRFSTCPPQSKACTTSFSGR